jgi:hypothetical protein
MIGESTLVGAAAVAAAAGAATIAAAVTEQASSFPPEMVAGGSALSAAVSFAVWLLRREARRVDEAALRAERTITDQGRRIDAAVTAMSQLLLLVPVEQRADAKSIIDNWNMHGQGSRVGG